MTIDPATHGNLLELANLLTKIQRHLVPEGLCFSQGLDEEQAEVAQRRQRRILVTPTDLQNVHDYQRLLDQQEELLNEIGLLEGLESFDERLRSFQHALPTQSKNQLQSTRDKIAEIPLRTKQVHTLWLRLQVWWTKVLAQQLFVMPVPNNNHASLAISERNKNTCCYAPFLSLPGGKHFCRLLPPVKGADPPVQSAHSAFHQNYHANCCSLPFPPNKYTWKEFARLSRMVALLTRKDTENWRGDVEQPQTATANSNNSSQDYQCNSLRLQKAINSPCVEHEILPNYKTKKPSQESKLDQFVFEPTDLIALWVRAQRNTQALRHLWMLFEINRDFKDLLRGDSNGKEGESNHRAYRATLRGNPGHTRTRIVDTSKLVDALVEWSVMNQVLFTHRYIKGQLLSQHLPTRKRQRSDGQIIANRITNATQPARKKARRELEMTEQEKFTLKMACHAMVLRWFARRNRSIASVLFSKHTEKMKLDLAANKVDIATVEWYSGQVDSEVKRYMNRPEIADIVGYKGDRFFDRVDRRLPITTGRYTGQITVADQVIALLTAMEHAREWTAVESAKISHAKQDIRNLYDHLLANSNDVYQTALDLVDLDVSSATEFTAILNSMPRPWPEGCEGCDKDSSEDFVTCVGCERIFHSQCAPQSTTFKLKKVLSLFDPMRQLCRLKVPKEIPLPDFSGDSSLEWEEVDITVERKLLKDGSVQQLGLSLRNTEDCADELKKLHPDRASVADLVGLLNFEAREKPMRVSFPMRGAKPGVIVVAAMDGDTSCGKAAGFKVGDVMVIVEHLKVPKSKANVPSGPVDLVSKSPSERINVLKIPSTKMKVKVLRPNKDIVGSSRAWYTALKRLNKTFCSALRDENFKLWFCGTCLDRKAPTDVVEPEKARIIRQAEQCKAVIRRIGLESYGLPFIDEDTERIQKALESHQSVDGMCVSLRRLDAMMTFIIEKQLGKKTLWPTREVFLLPPYASGERTSRRLTWAPPNFENEPAILLCRAMIALDGAPPEYYEDLATQKKGLIRHFLLAFSAWSVLATPGFEPQPKSRGVPRLFQRIREPWLQQTCISCYGRPSADEFSICLSCSGIVEKDQRERSDATKNIITEMRDYNSYSSLVGMTLLLPPNDPLVEGLKSVCTVKHNGRAVEFIVASYTPPAYLAASLFAKPKKKPPLDKFGDNDGIFHLLPVTSFTATHYLLHRCKMRQYGNDKAGDKNWVSLDVLNLDSVARYSPSELHKKIAKSESIRRAIDDAIAYLNGATQIENLPSFATTEWQFDQNKGSHEHDIFQSLAGSSGIQMQLVDSVLETSQPSAFLPSMFSAIVPADNVTGDELDLQSGTKLKPSTFINIGVDKSLEIVNMSTNGAMCHVLYSDLHYSNAQELSTLCESLSPQELQAPRRYQPSDCTEHSVLLVRDEVPALGIYQGIGFGFELLFWPGEDAPRVGRIHHKSPAFAAGLQTNDIVISAGGRKLSRSTTFTDMLSSIFGVPFVFRQPYSRHYDMAVVLSFCKRRKIEPHSVVLMVHRPSPSRNNSERMPPQAVEIQQPRMTGDDPTPLSSLQAEPDSTLQNGQILPQHPPVVLDNTTTTETPDSSPPPQIAPPVHPSEDRGDFPLCSSPQIEGVIRQPRMANGDTAQSTPMALGEPPSLQTDRSLPHQSSVIGEDMTITDGASSSPRQQQLDHPTVDKESMPTGAAGPNTMTSHLGPNSSQPNLSTSRVPQEPSEPDPSSQLLSQRVSQQVGNTETMSSLRSLLLSTYRQRREAQPSDLYLPARRGTVLTILEASLLLECVMRSQPKLGVRLLCPRYDMRFLVAQSRVVVGWTAEQVVGIPRLNSSLYNLIVQRDYDRTMDPTCPEPGPPVLFEGVYAYRVPVSALPIDRIAEVNFAGTAPAARIRGGGPSTPTMGHLEARLDSQRTPSYGPGLATLGSDEPNGLCISSTPRTNWKGKAVLALVETDGSVCAESMLVGWVLSYSAEGKSVVDSIVVEAWYSSVIGYFQKPEVFTIFTEDVFLVDEESETEAGAVIRKLRSQQLTPARSFYHNSQDSGDWLFNSKAQVEFSGYLPDGRWIMSILNDPAAIYVSKDLDTSRLSSWARDYAAVVLQNHENPPISMPKLHITPSTYCCPWGCSTANVETGTSRRALGFSTIGELCTHCKDSHLDISSGDFLQVGLKGQYIRICDKTTLKDLSIDLSAAIIARFPALCSVVSKVQRPASSPAEKFSKSPSGDLLYLPFSTLTQEAVRVVLEEGTVHSTATSLLALWMNLGRLLDLESEWDNEFKELPDIPTGGKCCHCPSTSKATNRRLGCRLCALPWETSIGWNVEGPGKEIRTRGTGCISLCEASGIGSGNGRAGMIGSLEVAKQLLLRAAYSLPERTRLLDQPKGILPENRVHLWDRENYAAWKRFVTEVSSARMICQAMIVLLAAIDRTCMPRWWGQEGGGWSTPQAVMANPSIATVLVHLHALDAAVAEILMQE